MRAAGFFTGALCALAITAVSKTHADSSFRCAGLPTPAIASSAAAKSVSAPERFLPSHGQVHALVVFAQFADEASGTATVPAFADALFDAERPGSFAHYYATMSFGQLQVRGTVLPRRYHSEYPAEAYLATQPGERGAYDRFVREILRQVDADVDFSRFDSDGPDGLPDSGDDDGAVDYVFVILRSVPRGFLINGATGIADLGMEEEDFLTADTSAEGMSVRVRGGWGHGAVLQARSFVEAVGVMAHEFGHGLGLPDLYDVSPKNPEEDSAGIGKWGLMGWGATGWNGDDGPTTLCAWSREQLGWTGRDNERLMVIEQDAEGLEIADLHQDGFVCKVPLRIEQVDGVFQQVSGEGTHPYLLLEQRMRSSHYYNRHLPAEGLLVWHVQPPAATNGREQFKLVDLVCADGLYADAGYPQGRVEDGSRGRDNLDFWAHDSAYREAHQGNLGDATDLFDGERFTRLAPGSNPASGLGVSLPQAVSGVALERIQRRGDGVVVDIRTPRWAGEIREEVHWMSEVVVDGDLTLAPEGKLVVHPGARVRFAGRDRLRSGEDADRCELRVLGELHVEQGFVSRYKGGREWEMVPADPVVFEALESGQSWRGITVGASGRFEAPEGSLELRDVRGDTWEVVSGDLPTVVFEGAEDRESASGLLPNYPNPFNAETTVRYALRQTSAVRLTVYDLLGQRVRVLVDGVRAEGTHAVMWDGRDEGGRPAGSGTYFCRLEARFGVGEFSEGLRMTLLK